MSAETESYCFTSASQQKNSYRQFLLNPAASGTDDRFSIAHPQLATLPIHCSLLHDLPIQTGLHQDNTPGVQNWHGTVLLCFGLKRIVYRRFSDESSYCGISQPI